MNVCKDTFLKWDLVPDVMKSCPSHQNTPWQQSTIHTHSINPCQPSSLIVLCPPLIEYEIVLSSVRFSVASLCCRISGAPLTENEMTSPSVEPLNRLVSCAQIIRPYSKTAPPATATPSEHENKNFIAVKVRPDMVQSVLNFVL